VDEIVARVIESAQEHSVQANAERLAHNADDAQ